MAYENIILEKKEGIATITVNRPKVLNALNDLTMRELDHAFRDANEDDAIGAVIFTGAGDRSFISGADISELTLKTPVSGRDAIVFGQSVLNYMESMRKPVIAAISGFCLGGGMEMAMACHIRLASKTAKLGQPEVKLGLMPGFGGTQRLPRLAGKGWAMELILVGDMISAEEGMALGVINHVYEPQELLPAAQKMARTIISRGPLAVRYCIEAINRGMNMPLQEGISYEATMMGVILASEDKTEGTRAFLEKRTPKFTGK
ncbi:MAG: enoyl-CoA hydratase/isomerase family protein [Candidatus Tectomicrobia bacterium]|nr:enoyl-CoA hydratase/isomerase family protein [Candidatus Tectomicrobia bacterium]